MSKNTITIDIDNGALIDQCAMRILDQHHGEYDEDGELIDNGKHNPKKQLDRVIREVVIARVRKHLDDSIVSISRDRIGIEVEAILAEGWKKTNNYGEPSGPKMTLRDRISEQLTSVKDNYNRKTWLDELIEKSVSAAFAAEFAKPIEEARAKFKAMLDGTIAAKLQESLKSALGLR